MTKEQALTEIDAEAKLQEDLQKQINRLSDRYNNRYEECFTTGEYEDQECEFCPHRGECSGWEEE